MTSRIRRLCTRSIILAAILISSRTLRTSAQQNPAQPRDTAVAQDTLAPVANDTTAPADSVRLRVFPAASAYGNGRYAAGVWVWERDSLENIGYITLGELLERMPATMTIRSGFYVQPEVTSSLGVTAGRIEVLLDGYVLDPLVAGTFDLSRLEMMNIRRVVAERRLDVLRISIETLAPFDRRPYASVEAGIAEPQTRMFRGVFLTPSLFRGPLGLAIERLDTDGYKRVEPGNAFSGWLKYALIRGRTGLQFEIRRADIDRNATQSTTITVPVFAPGEGSRTDWVVRARSEIRTGFTAELFTGRSTVTDSLDVAVILPDSVAHPIKEESMQSGARVSVRGTRGFADAVVRIRNDNRLARSQADISGSVRVIPQLEVGGGATWADWESAGSAVSYDGRAALTPIPLITLFGEAAGGKRGVPNFDGAAKTLLTERTGIRAGGELRFRRATLGGAFLKLKTDSVTPFGLPFDTLFRAYPGGDVTGWEASGSIPIYKFISVEGSYQAWMSGTRWIYLPDRIARGSLVIHMSPLPSGNLEIFARGTARNRGVMQVPTLPRADSVGVFIDSTVPEITAFDFDLHIRIMDFRLFFRSEDMLHKNDVFDVPGRLIPGPRIYYGVRWQFWN